jgi:hypothetical protein
MVVAARILEQAPADAPVEPLLPNLWAGIAQESGAPANIRVDSCLTLKYAYGQLGIRAELALADLTRSVRRTVTVSCTAPQNRPGTVTSLAGHR